MTQTNRRAFLIVIDSVGIGGAPDADQFFNGDVPDTGANTLGNIVQACAEGRAEEGRSGPLMIPNLAAMGAAGALNLASGLEVELDAAQLARPVTFAAASETSMAKIRPQAIGNWPACRCRGIGMCSPIKHRRFHLRSGRKSAPWRGRMAFCAMPMPPALR